MDSDETISEKCLEFFTNEEVLPIRGDTIDVVNLASLYVGDPMAETMGLRGCENFDNG